MQPTQTETSQQTNDSGIKRTANRPARPSASEPYLSAAGQSHSEVVTQVADRDLQIVREFERSLIDLERRMDRALRGFMGESGLRFPLLQGLALQEGPGGVLGFRPFGSLQIGEGIAGFREPVLTWKTNAERNEAEFRIEIPGLEKSDLKLEVAPDRIRIEGSRDEVRYQAECVPGHLLDPESAQANYEAGVLKLKIGLAKADANQARTVKIR